MKNNGQAIWFEMLRGYAIAIVTAHVPRQHSLALLAVFSGQLKILKLRFQLSTPPAPPLNSWGSYMNMQLVTQAQ